MFGNFPHEMARNHRHTLGRPNQCLSNITGGFSVANHQNIFVFGITQMSEFTGMA